VHLSVASVGKAVLTLALGVVVGTMGTVMHRSVRPWGLVVCLLLVVAAAVTARAVGGGAGLIGYVLGLGATVLTLAQEGPGGDTLVPSGQAIGMVWLIGSVLLAVAVALLPRRWFSDAPRPARPTRAVTDLPDAPA